MVSRKSETNVMVKNMLDIVLGGASFWFIGYGLAFGSDGNSFAGNSNFLLGGELNASDGKQFAKFVFQLTFAATATTIVSGAVAERIKLSAYMIFAIVNSGLTYPFPAHWMWHPDGWLVSKGAYDFAGSSVVHISGGIAALVAAIMLGPRAGRFENRKKEYFMASPTNVVLGTFFLWWGWIGFNCGSTQGLSHGRWYEATRVAVVTIVGGVGGGLSSILLCIWLKLFTERDYTINITQFVTGILGGLVSVTALANACQPWEGMLIGSIGGMVANATCVLLEKLKIDDPIGAFSVHYASGVWGMLATGLFAENEADKSFGLFRGGDGTLLGWNIVAMISITAWSGTITAFTFLLVKYTSGIRLKADHERMGSDFVEHKIVDDALHNNFGNFFNTHAQSSFTSYNDNTLFTNNYVHALKSESANQNTSPVLNSSATNLGSLK